MLITRLGVHRCPCLQEVLDQVQMALLGGLHERCAGSELDLGPRLDQEVRHLHEAAAARQGQGGLLGLLRLGVDVGAWN